MLCIITKCVKSQQNDLFKERYKKVYAPKEGLQKRTLAQNCFNLTLQNEITTKLFLYKKDKIYLLYKSSDIKNLCQL